MPLSLQLPYWLQEYFISFLNRCLSISWFRGISASVGLFFNINRNTGLKVYSEVVLENSDLLNQAADQRLIKFGDGAGLLFDEILQLPDLLHLFIFDDTVHLSLPALIPEAENLICNGIVVVFLVDFFGRQRQSRRDGKFDIDFRALFIYNNKQESKQAQGGDRTTDSMRICRDIAGSGICKGNSK